MFITVRVSGESMLPGLRPGDCFVVRRGAAVRAGDVVIARRGDLLIIKRAFRRTDEGWWLESDNQAASGRQDSWDFGAMPDEDIVGRVLFRYWPPRWTPSRGYAPRWRAR
ncbi:S24 family peptidase [Streptosporangiaceae bacterium NEAU-GS5]|nr:S24 family peptidase [Streptosporangiaceae bacterium NEAU-GS5]